MSGNRNEKWCPKCENYIHLTGFGINRSRTDGLQNWCRSCLSKYHKRIASENKKKWAKENPHEGSK